MAIAVIADIVGSRQLPDRAAAQIDLEAALVRVDELVPTAVRPLRPTVGDELQGVYAELAPALAATLLLMLSLPEGLEVRFGIGIGEINTIPSAAGALSEGPAWWAARAAIERAEQLARREMPDARTWVAASPDESGAVAELVRIANSGLLARDRLIGQWNSRTRRLVFGRIAGATQAELAESEGVTQSAVSQALALAGSGAIIAGYHELTGT